MSIPIRHLPVMQQWDCHGCSDCCRIEAVVTDEEKRRIEALDLADDSEIGPRPWFTPMGRGSGKWRLNHRPDGGCVFLTAENHCRLQERFGPEVKPFVCRLFPFVLIPAGDHWRVGMRFSCPSATANSGRPVTEAKDDLVELSRLLEHHVGRSAATAPPPLLQAGQTISWADACRIVEVLVEIMQDRSDPVERRLRKCLALARVGGQTHWDNVRGNRVTKFLQAVRIAMDVEVPRDPSALPAPHWLFGGVLFRSLLAIYATRDRNTHRATRIGQRLARVHAAWRFARGRGNVPRVNEFMPKVRFDEIERPHPTGHDSQPEVEEILERYYAVKLNSLQFFGPPNFNLPLWAGLESLVLTLPMIRWLARAFHDIPPAEAIQRAIQLVDDHFGGDPMLGFPHIQAVMRTISQRGEIEKLVAWHCR